MNTTLTDTESRLSSTRDFLAQGARVCELGTSNQCIEAGYSDYCSRDGSNVYINCPRYNAWFNRQTGE